eukprot:CAMPEP_0115511560 /NCGR_PEP_ID=MMETSP0271-20121206/74036_1 /TAXON_ID=71861 /ORGANISM="Scrippsiella trochoidea, Strain CCMP3099" /LENGTH=51 /DNA_ID=CAMNT_0002941649 /DNA_START=607 /DNA_END=762 /DNA_ORIENTATION=+
MWEEPMANAAATTPGSGDAAVAARGGRHQVGEDHWLGDSARGVFGKGRAPE